MALTQSQRNQIASYKIQIEGFRKQLASIKASKKSRSDYFANTIKNTKDANTKRSYKQSKISEMNSFANQIESKKNDIERIKNN